MRNTPVSPSNFADAPSYNCAGPTPISGSLKHNVQSAAITTMPSYVPQQRGDHCAGPRVAGSGQGASSPSGSAQPFFHPHPTSSSSNSYVDGFRIAGVSTSTNFSETMAPPPVGTKRSPYEPGASIAPPPVGSKPSPFVGRGGAYPCNEAKVQTAAEKAMRSGPTPPPNSI